MAMGRICYGPILTLADFFMGRNDPESFTRHADGHTYQTFCTVLKWDGVGSGRVGLVVWR